MKVYVDGLTVAKTTANLARPDFGAAQPGYGDLYGFNVLVPARPGDHLVCAEAINKGTHGVNIEFGCKRAPMPACPTDPASSLGLKELWARTNERLTAITKGTEASAVGSGYHCLRAEGFTYPASRSGVVPLYVLEGGVR